MLQYINYCKAEISIALLERTVKEFTFLLDKALRATRAIHIMDILRH